MGCQRDPETLQEWMLEIGFHADQGQYKETCIDRRSASIEALSPYSNKFRSLSNSAYLHMLR